MKKIVFFIAVAAVLASCSPERQPGGDDLPGSGADALELYWAEDYSGPLGIQVSQTPTPLMLLAGEPLYVSGVNCYNLFLQSVNSTMNTSRMEATVEVLVKENVPVVRFAASVYHADQIRYYTEQKEQFLANLKKLAQLCDEAHILLIPSVFWQIATLPQYFGEDYTAYGDTGSSIYEYVLSYTEDIVNTLKGHKCIAAWEFGNEFNLAADIAIAGYPDIPASAISTVMKGFAEKVASLDPQGRLIASGNSVMRNAQWHLAHERNWTVDSFSQYVEMTGVMTPSPMRGMSEHIYEEARSFSDLGTLDRSEQIAKSQEAAAQLGKVFYVGEFTGPSDNSAEVIKGHYDDYFDRKVQLSLIWNYAYLGDVEHSFKAGTHQGNIAFNYMREINKKFRTFVGK